MRFLPKRTTPNIPTDLCPFVAYNYTLPHTAVRSCEMKKEWSLFLIHMPHQLIIFVMRIHSFLVCHLSLSFQFAKCETEEKG